MQLKFFVTSYVNSLERRKYVAVWFSSIQERIQCWPAQYSYDLIVNLFGKVFVHVRSCLLMKKMSDAHKSNRGKTKTLTDSTRKRHKKEDSTKYNKTRVSIGDEYDRWTELKDVLWIKHAEIIHSSYRKLLGKLRNCSRFIINHVLMAIPPTDDAKHSNSFHQLRHYNRLFKPDILFTTFY